MYKVGIVGCGRISKRHIEAIEDNPELELVTVCDLNEERGCLLTEKYRVSYYKQHLQMVQDESLDIVSILTEAGHHAKIAIDCAPYVKNIIVEKPMALKLSDADDMINACEINGTKLFVVKQNRYNLPVMQLKKAMKDGRFGKLTMGTVRVRWARHQEYFDMDAWRGTWALDGGVLASQASHHVDMLQWLMGPVKSVMAMAKTQLVDIEVEDTAVVILEFINGALGVIEATNAARPENIEGSVSILGEGGTVVIGGNAMNKMDTWKFTEKWDSDNEVFSSSENPPDVYGFGHKRFYDDVVKNIETNVGAIDGIEGRKSLELANAIYEAIETGKKIDLKFKPEHVRLGR